MATTAGSVSQNSASVPARSGGSPSRARFRSALRILFGVVWAVDASFKWTSGFRANYTSDLQMSAHGQPGWLSGWFNFWLNHQHPALFFAYLVAVIETLLAIGLLFGVLRRTVYCAGALFSFLVWSVAEGFGGPYTSESTDIGTSIIYVIVFLCLLELDALSGPDRTTVDHYMNRRRAWWRPLAGS